MVTSLPWHIRQRYIAGSRLSDVTIRQQLRCMVTSLPWHIRQRYIALLASEVTPGLLAGAEPDTHQFNVTICL
jgi:hypothetical protein